MPGDGFTIVRSAARGAFDIFFCADKKCLENFSLERFIENNGSAAPINLICSGNGGLKRKLCDKVESLAGRYDLRLLPYDLLRENILPRSNSVIMDADTAYELIKNHELIKHLSLNTLEWVLLPLYAKELPFICFYSKEFSYQEIWENSSGSVKFWRWATSPEPASISVVNCRESGEYKLVFTLTATSPGNLTVTFGDFTQTTLLSTKKLEHTFTINARLEKGLQSQPLIVSFDGEPLAPANPLEVRKKLYYGFSDFKLLRVTKDTITARLKKKALNDFDIRKIFHENGFFEIASVDTQSVEKTGMIGLRSCFDYLTGFSVRDYKQANSPYVVNAWDKNGMPVIWYLLRKTPTPYSEF